MLRRITLGAVILFMVIKGASAAAFNVDDWMKTNGLVICDNQISVFELPPDKQARFKDKYYTPLTFFVGAEKIAQSNAKNVHWFIVNEKVVLPDTASGAYDERVRNLLYAKLSNLMKDNDFKLAGLMTTGPYPTPDSPYTYFIVGLQLTTALPNSISQVVPISDQPPPEPKAAVPPMQAVPPPAAPLAPISRQISASNAQPAPLVPDAQPVTMKPVAPPPAPAAAPVSINLRSSPVLPPAPAAAPVSINLRSSPVLPPAPVMPPVDAASAAPAITLPPPQTEPALPVPPVPTKQQTRSKRHASYRHHGTRRTWNDNEDDDQIPAPQILNVQPVPLQQQSQQQPDDQPSRYRRRYAPPVQDDLGNQPESSLY